jgi:hypothetical protein
MDTELRVTLPGAVGSDDARRSLRVVQRILDLLGNLEDARLADPDHTQDHTVWAFTAVSLSSFTATLAPNIPKPGATTDLLTEVMSSFVDGFDEAERAVGVPERWSREAALTGADLAQLLGYGSSEGVKLELLRDGAPVRDVLVTRVSAEHLRSGMQVRRASIGALTGRLDSVQGHRELSATLWPDGAGPSVRIRFVQSQEELIRSAWRRRVMVRGRIERDVLARPIQMRMQSLEILSDYAPPLSALVGIDPLMTGGLDPHDYLGEIRGAS